MNYENDELNAPVWDVLGNNDVIEELSNTFANLNNESTHDTAFPVEECWRDENSVSNSSTERHIAGELLSSLAPKEELLQPLTVTNNFSSPTRNDPLFSDNHQNPLILRNSPSPVTMDLASSVVGRRKMNKLFSTQRMRRQPLTKEQEKELIVDPLAKDDTDEFIDEPLEENDKQDMIMDVFQNIDAPLFTLSPRNTDQIKNINNENPKAKSKTHFNKFKIDVSDPVKVGDITSAYIQYTVSTKSELLDPCESIVQRRYRDFRWLYRQLQSNNWGIIIPPPPEKQTVGRFNQDFVENRRFQMQSMLTKISEHSILQNDSDFIMFLTSVNFGEDSKSREQVSRSQASHDSNDISEIHISEIELLGSEDAEVVIKNGGLDNELNSGFMGLSFSTTPKYTESDSFFTEQRQQTEALEEQLKQLYKSLELVDIQRNDLISITEEFANSIESLAQLEVSKKISESLLNFSEVHMRIKESMERACLQDSLTLGVMINEYMRLLGSVKAILNQRMKLGNFLVILETQLSKKQKQFEKVTRNIISQTDRSSVLEQELVKIQSRLVKVKSKWQDIANIIREELNNFDRAKIVDFRNNMEIYLESSIETQKECIELWETFYQNNL